MSAETTNPAAPADLASPSLDSQGDGFNIRAAIELDRQGRAGRLVFSLLVGLISCSILPWPIVAGWVGAIVGWEAFCFLTIDRPMAALPHDRAIVAFAVSNLLGSCLYQFIALIALSVGSPIGIAIGATWLGGSFMNSFIYFGQNRRILWSSLAPAIAAAIVGPALGHGVSLAGAIISGLILTGLIAARSFSVDHQVLLDRLGERQSALADVEGKLSIAVEASGDGLFETDLIAGERQVSTGWKAMLGYGPDELDNPDLLELIHPDDRAMVQQEFAAHFEGKTPHTTSEQRMRCRDGSYKWVLARARLVSRTPDGRPWRMIGTTIDISARKALEHQLEAARDVAERANAGKSMFVANMSHEIRTPLNGVIGIAGVLARTNLTAEQREMVDLVQSSAHILERLLSDVLDQSKIESGEFQLQLAPFDLRETVDAAAELMRPRAEEKDLGFHVTYAQGADGVFEGDAVRLRQVISNLAANAIKFTDSGEVRIAVDTGQAADGATLVTITVADTGIGFDAAAAERLFGRFVQADGSISRRFGGTGLGLSISRALVELMGGDIGASSTPGAGSRFTIQLPLRRVGSIADDGALLADAEAEEAEATVAIAGARILLAEDHPTNQRVVQLVLTPFGIDLTIVGDGQEAVEAFRPGLFDLILMDMQMPRMDGLAATREIRRLEREAGVSPTPIAMLTANAMEEHRRMAAEAGATDHITKPITPESLVAGIARALAAIRPDEIAQPGLRDAVG
ncbi:MAG: ATP-binding protein [Caulobacterales bacterium]